MLQGYDGVCYIVFNLAAMLILFATAWEYWCWRTESPLLILTLSGLYVVTGISFGLCSVVLIDQGSWIMGHAPDDWAEDINLIVCLTGHRRHRRTLARAQSSAAYAASQARRRNGCTDRNCSIGVHSSIALKACVRPWSWPCSTSTTSSKSTMSTAIKWGDVVLQTFAGILAETVREGDLAARFGGEEFAVLLPDTSLKAALIVAERITKEIRRAALHIRSDALFGSSVSVGISQIASHAELTDLFVQADRCSIRSEKIRPATGSSFIPIEIPSPLSRRRTINPIKVNVSPAPDRSDLYKTVGRNRASSFRAQGDD